MERKTHRQFLKKRANTVSARREWSNIVQMQMLQSTSCNNTNLRVFRMAININKHTQKNLKNSKINKHGQKLYQQRNKLQIQKKKKKIYIPVKYIFSQAHETEPKKERVNTPGIHQATTVLHHPIPEERCSRGEFPGRSRSTKEEENWLRGMSSRVGGRRFIAVHSAV